MPISPELGTNPYVPRPVESPLTNRTRTRARAPSPPSPPPPPPSPLKSDEDEYEEDAGRAGALTWSRFYTQLPAPRTRRRNTMRPNRGGAPPPSTVRARPLPSRATPREVPCARCLASALAGRSDGVCHDTLGTGSRCYRCASGHVCTPLDAHVAPFAIKLSQALVRRAPESELKVLRAAARGAQGLPSKQFAIAVAAVRYPRCRRRHLPGPRSP